VIPRNNRCLKTRRTIQNLDNSFTFSKKAAENLNPSGSASVGQLLADNQLLIRAPHIGVPFLISKNVLARLLTNPTTAAIVPRRNQIAGALPGQAARVRLSPFQLTATQSPIAQKRLPRL
jgi:hypothetical protein